MSERTINIYVPGILTVPGDARNWCGRAVTHTHVHSTLRAEKVEYLSGFGFSRSLFQNKRADKLISTLEWYAGWTINIVAHSNGCDVVLDALGLNQRLSINHLHLLCGACESDFQRNGMNMMLIAGQIKRAIVYVAGKDFAMHLARSCMGRLFGFGTLGLHGARNVRSELWHDDKLTQRTWPNYGHSDCWADDHFLDTMAHFIPNEA